MPTVADLNISDPPAGADADRAAAASPSAGADELLVAWNRDQQAGNPATSGPLAASLLARPTSGPLVATIDRVSRLDSVSPVFSGLPAFAPQMAASFAEQGGSGWEGELPFGSALQELGLATLGRAGL
jgi:hypothetical protein